MSTSETIVIPTGRTWWWALGLALPLPLTFSRAFMDLVAPLPYYNPRGYYDTPPTFADVASARGTRETIVIAAFVAAFVGIALLLISFVKTKTIVVIDRDARVVRVQTRKGTWDVAFGERPTLVEREQMYWLQGDKVVPIAIAERNASHESLERLRRALAAVSS